MKRAVLYMILTGVLALSVLAEPPVSGLTPQQVQEAKRALDAYAGIMAQAVELQNASYRANRQAKTDPSYLPQAQAAQQAFLEKDKEVKASAEAYLKLTSGWCATVNRGEAHQAVLGFNSDGKPQCVPHTPDYWMLLQLRSVGPADGAAPPRP